MGHDNGSDVSSKTEIFRAVLRIYAIEAGGDVNSAMMKLLASADASAGNSNFVISKDKFCELLNSVRTVRQKFTPNDLVDVYSEAMLELGHPSMTPAQLAEYFSRTISKARGLAQRLRKVIAEDYPGGVPDYERAFEAMTSAGSDSADLDALTDFCEDLLDLPEGSVSDKQARELYSFVDRDGAFPIFFLFICLLFLSLCRLRRPFHPIRGSYTILTLSRPPHPHNLLITSLSSLRLCNAQATAW